MAEKRPPPSPSKPSATSAGVFGRLGGLLWRSGSSTGKPPAGGSKKKVKVNLPEGNDFYYDEKSKSWRERGKEANGDEPARPSSPPRAFSGPPSRVGSNVSLAGMGVGEGAAAEMSSPSRANGSASSLSALSPNAYSNRGSAKDLRNRYVDVSGAGKRGGQDSRAGSFGSLNELLTPGLSTGASGPSSVGKVSMFMPLATASSANSTPAVFNPGHQSSRSEGGLNKNDRRLSQSLPVEFVSGASPAEAEAARTKPAMFVPQRLQVDESGRTETGTDGGVSDNTAHASPAKPGIFVPQPPNSEETVGNGMAGEGGEAGENGTAAQPARFVPRPLNTEGTVNGDVGEGDTVAGESAPGPATQPAMFVPQPRGTQEEEEGGGMAAAGDDEAGTAVHPATKPLVALFDQTLLKESQSGADFFAGLPSPATTSTEGVPSAATAEPSALSASNLGGTQLSHQEDAGAAQPSIFVPQVPTERVKVPEVTAAADTSLAYTNRAEEDAGNVGASSVEATYAAVPYLDVSGSWQEYYGDVNGEEYKYYYQAYCDYCAYYYGGQAAGEQAMAYGVEGQEGGGYAHEQQQYGYGGDGSEGQATVAISDHAQWQAGYGQAVVEDQHTAGEGWIGTTEAVVVGGQNVEEKEVTETVDGVAEDEHVGGEEVAEKGVMEQQLLGEEEVIEAGESVVEVSNVEKEEVAGAVESVVGQNVGAQRVIEASMVDGEGDTSNITTVLYSDDEGDVGAGQAASPVPGVSPEEGEASVTTSFVPEQPAVSENGGSAVGNGVSGETAAADNAETERAPSKTSSVGAEEGSGGAPKRRASRKKKALNSRAGKLSKALPWEEEQATEPSGGVIGDIGSGLLGLGGLLGGLVVGQPASGGGEDLVPLGAASPAPLARQPSTAAASESFVSVDGSFTAAELPLPFHRDEADAGSSNWPEGSATLLSEPQTSLPTTPAARFASAEVELLPARAAAAGEASFASVPEALGVGFSAEELPLLSHVDPAEAGSSIWPEGRSVRSTTEAAAMIISEEGGDSPTATMEQRSSYFEELPTSPTVRFASAELHVLPTQDTQEEEVSQSPTPVAFGAGFSAEELPLPSHVDPAEAGSSNWPEGRSARSTMTGEVAAVSLSEEGGDSSTATMEQRFSYFEELPTPSTVHFASAESQVLPSRASWEEETSCAAVPEAVGEGFSAAELPLPSRVDPAEAGSSNWPENRSVRSIMTAEEAMLADEVGGDSPTAMREPPSSKFEELSASPAVRFASAELELVDARPAAAAAAAEASFAFVPEAAVVGFSAAELPLPSHVDPAEAGSSNWPEGRSARSILTTEASAMLMTEGGGESPITAMDQLPTSPTVRFASNKPQAVSVRGAAACREEEIIPEAVGVGFSAAELPLPSGVDPAEAGSSNWPEARSVRSIVEVEMAVEEDCGESLAGVAAQVPLPVAVVASVEGEEGWDGLEEELVEEVVEAATAPLFAVESGELYASVDVSGAHLGRHIVNQDSPIADVGKQPVHVLAPHNHTQAANNMGPHEQSGAWDALALGGAVDYLLKGVEAVQAAEELAAEVAACRLGALEAENAALRDGRRDAADRCRDLERRVAELHAGLEVAALPQPAVYRADLLVDEAAGCVSMTLKESHMLPGALEAENAALRSELGRRMEEVARLLELEGGQNQLLREQLDKRGVEVEMVVELEQANGALRSELEEKEVALAALHEELEALRAGGWADLTSENEALAAEQERLTALLAEAREKARAELEAPSTPGVDAGGLSEGRLVEAAEELAEAVGRVEALQTALAEQAAEAESVQEGLHLQLQEQTALVRRLEEALDHAKAEAAVVTTETAQRCEALEGQLELVAAAAEAQDAVRAGLMGAAEAAASLAVQLGDAQAEAALLAEGRDRAEAQKAELQARAHELEQAVSAGNAECQALHQQLSEAIEREAVAVEGRRVAEATAEELRAGLAEAVAGREVVLGQLNEAAAAFETAAAESAARVAELEGQLAGARADAASARSEAESARAEVAAGAEASSAAAEEARAKLKAAVKKGKGIEKELDEARAKLKAAVKKGKAIEKDKVALEERLAEAEAATAAAESRCSELSEQLGQAAASGGAAAEATAEAEALRGELSAAAVENEALKSELHSAFAAASAAEERMDAMCAAALAAEASIAASDGAAAASDEVGAAVAEVAEAALGAARSADVTAGAATADAAAMRAEAATAAESAAEEIEELRREMDALRARAEAAELRLSAVEEEGEELRATVDVQQGEFNDLLACLGQETAKVEALQAVLEEQGVDVDDILAKVEEEYGFGDGDDDGEEREED